MAEQVKNWYVIRAVSGEEKKVKEYLESEISRLNIRDYIPQVLIPTEKVYTIRNGKKVSIERSYLPGYVLIEALLVGEIQHVIKNVPGVLGFLGNQGDPVPLRPAEVQRILHKVDELADSPEKPVEPFMVGEPVKVTDGPFNNFSAIIEEVNEEKKKLYLYDSSRNKILRYDLLTGTFEDEISLDGPPFYADIAYQSDFLYAYQSNHWPAQGDTPYYLLHQIDLLQAGKMTASLLDYDSYNQGWQNEFLNFGTPFTRVGDELWFCTALMDTVMAIREGEVYPVLAIHGEKVIKRDDLLKDSNLHSSGDPVALTKKMMQQYMHLTQKKVYWGFCNFYVHQGYLWFNCYGGSLLKVRHHLKSGQTSIFQTQKDDIFFAGNKQNGVTLPGYLCADADGVFYFYNTEQLAELKRLFESGQLSDKVVNKELIRSLESDSNPVLLYYEFKD